MAEPVRPLGENRLGVLSHIDKIMSGSHNCNLIGVVPR